MHFLENNHLRIAVSEQGAELRGLYSVLENREYMWQRDAAYWSKSSPILFPIVGELVQGRYTHKGVEYKLPKHGFARDHAWAIVDRGKEGLCFRLVSTAETVSIYPFDFELFVCYSLADDKLCVRYEVVNVGLDTMYFSIGGHPAFQLDFSDGQSWDDYFLRWKEDDDLKRYYIQQGLLRPDPASVPLQNRTLPLTSTMFDQDAWVLDHVRSQRLELQNVRGDYRLLFDFEGFTQFGLWSAIGSSFLCLEPWCGLNDFGHHDGRLQHKYGIQYLGSGETFQASWSVTVGV